MEAVRAGRLILVVVGRGHVQVEAKDSCNGSCGSDPCGGPACTDGHCHYHRYHRPCYHHPQRLVQKALLCFA